MRRPSPPRAGPDLVLVPTALERRQLEALGGLPGARVELCGFGPVSAAAETARLLADVAPRRVLLIGIAGSLAPSGAPLGGAQAFASVRLDGVGAGSGPAFRPASALGFPHWDGGPGERIEDALELAPGGADELLTVCSASASPTEADERRRRYPAAVAEDMEGFAVAFACRRSGVPLAIVRGLSNVAGERERRSWRVAEALAAARERALAWLARTESHAAPGSG